MLGVVAMLLMPLVVSTSCRKQKPDEEPDESQNSIKSGQLVVYSNDRTKWIYVSFVQGKVVGEASSINPNNPENTDTVSGDKEWKARKDWDVALSWTRWRTNGGTSGKGQCAVARTEEKDFAKVTEVPAPSAFVADDSIQVYYEHKWDKIATFGNALLSDVVTMVHQGGGPPIFAFSPKVLVLRTAKGRYLKLQVTGYMDKAKSRYLQISFRYQELKRQP